MQQAIYNTLNSINSTGIAGTSIAGSGVTIQVPKTTTRRTSLARRIARRWDMIGVLALMGSSAAYAVSALAHLGL